LQITSHQRIYVAKMRRYNWDVNET